jgi:hypothetical protein
VAGVITVSESSWITPFSGMSPRQFSKLITALRREGADPVRKGRPWSLPLEDRVLRADERQDGNTPDLEVVILGGQPIREPMAHYGPFVMNTREELQQAFEDFQKGRLGTIPAVHGMSEGGL